MPVDRLGGVTDGLYNGDRTYKTSAGLFRRCHQVSGCAAGFYF
jgi:hypothetical protein